MLPRGERRSTCWSISPQDVSIRSRRGATCHWTGDSLLARHMFLSTLPRGRRPDHTCREMRTSFYPRSRAGRVASSRASLAAVSIRAPARGATTDDLRRDSISAVNCFYPRSARGGANSPPMTDVAAIRFPYPRSRAGSDPAAGEVLILRWRCFYPHAPARGATGSRA